MQDLNKLHEKIIGQIRKYEALAKDEEEAKLKYIIAQKLRLHRATNHLTQDQLATKLGVNRIQIIRWEQGISKPQKLLMQLLKDRGILDLDKKQK